MDYPVQDFASAGGSGDGDPRDEASTPALTEVEAAAVLHLTGIFGESNRITAKSRMLFHDVREGTGLTGSEIQTLVAIAHAAEPCSVPQIGRFLGSPRQVVQRAIKVLEREGFVAPLANQDHKRAPLLAPTEKGRAATAIADAVARDTIVLLVRSLPAETLGAVHAGMIALREQVDRLIGVQED